MKSEKIRIKLSFFVIDIFRNKNSRKNQILKFITESVKCNKDFDQKPLYIKKFLLKMRI